MLYLCFYATQLRNIHSNHSKNKNMKRLLCTSFYYAFLISLSLFSNLVKAQTEDLLPVKKLKKDFSQLVKLIEAHPKPYRHISEKDHKKMIKNIRQSLDKPMSDIDFYKKIAPIITSIKDGHTSIRLSPNWYKKYFEKNGIFPFKIYLSDDCKMYVIKNRSEDKTIKEGAEILAFNDVAIPEFVNRISKYISYELENFRNFQIESAISFYLMLEFGDIQSVKVDYFSDKKHTHVVKYIDYKNRKKELEESEIKRKKRLLNNTPYEYEKLSDDIGLFKIYSFAISDRKKYEEFLRKKFKKIKADHIKSLIIDIRGNTGGFPSTVSSLIHYVSNKYFKTMAYSEMKASEVYKKYFSDRSGAVNLEQVHFRRQRHFINLDALFSAENGTLVKEDAIYNEPPRELPNEFSGDLYLLIDKRSYSASSSFAATFRCYQLGILVGEKTGGTKVFHANSMVQKLQKSGIYVHMATARDYTTCFLKEDEAIAPDIEVKPTVYSLIADQDFVLSYTIRVINKINKIKAEQNK